MATNTKIVLMDLTDSWSPHTIDKLNYNFQSILASLNNKRGTPSGGSDITMADVDAEINSLVGDGTITLTQNGTFKGDFSVNQQGNKTIDLDAGGSGGSQQQSDWAETDNTKVTFIKNKPQNLVQDASYVHTDNNYTDSDKSKLSGIAAGAEVNVQADWNVTDNTSDAFINHKPTIPTKTSDLTNDSDFVESSDLATVATTGDYDDLIDTPNLASVATSGLYSDLSGTPALATVATSGSYNDLSNKPTIPAAQIQSDWSQTNTSAADYIKNKPTIPAAPVQSDWNEADTSSLAYIQNKPSIPEAAGNSDTPAMDGTGAVGQSAKYAKADHIHPTDTGRAAASHTHGRITNDGKVSGTAVGISSGNHLVITDNNNEIKMSGLSFSSDTTQFLRHDGNWATPSGSGGAEGTGAWSGYCNTIESTSDKTIITEGDITEAMGASLYVEMWQPNSLENGAEAITFKIGNSGASYPVYVNGSSTSAQNRLTWATDDILEFVFVDDVNPPLGRNGWEYVGGSSTMPIKGTYSYNNLSDKPTIPAAPVQSDWNETDATSLAYIENKPSIPSKTSDLTNDSGFITEASIQPMFEIEQYTVINGASTANNGVAENTLDITKSGYYPLGIIGWTSSNRYPNVYGCRLTERNNGSGKVFVGASNFSGSTRTLTVSAVVLWVKVS